MAENIDQKYDDALVALAHGPRASESGVAGRVRPQEPSSHASVSALAERFDDAVLSWEVMAGDEHVVYVRPERLLELMRWLKEDPAQRYLFLSDVTAVDYGGGRPIQVVYQLWSLEHRRQLRIKAELPLSGLEIDSVEPIWKTANWLEREVYDLFGVRFRGHPDLRRIMMPENYAEGHPLRKDFPLRGRFSRAEQTRRALTMDTQDFYTPQELVFMQDEDEAATLPEGAPGGPGQSAGAPESGPGGGVA